MVRLSQWIPPEPTLGKIAARRFSRAVMASGEWAWRSKPKTTVESASTLVAMGVRWLSRQCSVVLYEFATAADENPDVIGWAPEASSVVIECKLNRSDFLKDATGTALGRQGPSSRSARSPRTS
jgi:hypothetical protein